MKKNLLILLSLINFTVFGATILVTNTDDTGAGSLREAVANANAGDIVRIDNSLLGSGNVTINLQSRIDINRGIFIKGAYNETDTVLISGSNTNQIFYIYMTTASILPTVDFDSLVLVNGNGAGVYGGAIQIDYHTVEGTVYFRNSIFRNNTAASGGAIGSYRNPVGSPKCKVKISLHNCDLMNNTATDNGGAIACHMNSSQSTEPKVEIEMFNSNIIYNSCSQKGGAIYAYAYAFNFSTFNPVDATTLIYLEKSTISHNSSQTEGGGIYAKATDNNGGYNTLCKIDCQTSTLSHNSGISNGGAAFCHSSDFAHINLYRSSVLYNTTFLDGSAFYLKSDNSNNADNSRTEITGNHSVIAHNNGNANYNNSTYFTGGYHQKFRSNGYNVFDFDYTHFPDLQYPLNWFVEYWDIDQSLLNFLPFEMNQNGTYTIVPADGNYCIGRGYVDEIGDAQNGPILGVRDVGAAESAICTAIPSSETASICQGQTYNFYGQNLANAGSYEHTIVTQGACDTLVTLTLTVTPNVSPTISIVANPGNTIMTGTPVTITATITNGGASPIYQWLANGSAISGAPNANSVVSSNLTNGVIISCRLTSNATCLSSTTLVSNAITFSVHANNDEPCDAITLGVNQTCVTEYFANHIATATPNVGAHSCASNTSKDIWFKFTCPPSGEVDIFTYSGTLTDAVLSVYQGNTCSSLFEAGCVDDIGANQMPQGVVTGGTPGEIYYVRVSSFGNTASGNFGICVVETPSTASLSDFAPNEEIVIFPNPTNKSFKLINTNGQINSIKIVNSLGQLVMEKNQVKISESFIVSELQNGIYHVIIESEKGQEVKQLVIQN